jgi:hypothetical protein
LVPRVCGPTRSRARSSARCVIEMAARAAVLSPSHPREETGNVAKRWDVERPQTASSDDIQRSDQHSSTRLLIRRFGVRIPGGPPSLRAD